MLDRCCTIVDPQLSEVQLARTNNCLSFDTMMSQLICVFHPQDCSAWAEGMMYTECKTRKPIVDAG